MQPEGCYRRSACRAHASRKWINCYNRKDHRWEWCFTEWIIALLTQQGCCGVLHDVTLVLYGRRLIFFWFPYGMRHCFRDASGTCACVCVGRGKMLAWDSKETLKGFLIRIASKSRDRMWHVRLSVECVTMVICVFGFFSRALSFSALAGKQSTLHCHYHLHLVLLFKDLTSVWHMFFFFTPLSGLWH